MKKFLIYQAVWLAFIAVFVAAIAYPALDGLKSVAAVLLWTFNTVILFAIFAQSSNLNDAKEGKAEAIARLRAYVSENPERSMFRKTWSWTKTITLTCLAAYTGMVFAAPLFLLIAFLAHCVHVGNRDGLAQIDAIEAAHDADA